MYPPTGTVHFKVILGPNMALVAYATEYENFTQLTINQLELIGKVLKYLVMLSKQLNRFQKMRHLYY